MIRLPAISTRTDNLFPYTTLVRCIVTFGIASNGSNTPVSKTVDLSRGRGIDLKLVGLDFDKQFGAFSFSNKLAYSAGNAPTIAQFTGATPVTLGSFINSQITTANSNAPALAAAGRPDRKSTRLNSSH